MQGAFQAGPVVVAKIADLLHQMIQVFPANLLLVQCYVAGGKAGLRDTTQVQHYFQQFFQIFLFKQAILDPLRQHLQQSFQFFLDQLLRCCQFMPPPEPSRDTAPGWLLI